MSTKQRRGCDREICSSSPATNSDQPHIQTTSDELPLPQITNGDLLNAKTTNDVQSFVSGKGTQDMNYSIEDIPPWYECVIYGFQVSKIFSGGQRAMPSVIVFLLHLSVCCSTTWP